MDHELHDSAADIIYLFESFEISNAFEEFEAKGGCKVCIIGI